jgi:putative ABC transport system ATP-binding protein
MFIQRQEGNMFDLLNKKEISRSKENMLIVENVKKTYEIGEKGYMALRGVSIRINKGDLMAIVGKSGSGKSTLLNLLGGIDKPTEGRIVINGKEINSLGENQLSRFRGENIGFVFQFFQLMPTLTVVENVIMPMDFSRKIPVSKRKERAEMLLDKVGISSHAYKFPSALSGGEQQRVAIARALSNNPDIILADEPTGNLDSQTTDDIFSLLKNLTFEGKNVVMVTHNEELAEQCSRIIRIRDGLIVEDVYMSNNGRRQE